jgi:hypothetical protein
LFRQTAGVAGLTNADLATIREAFERLLRAFSDWFDPFVAHYPTGHPERDFSLARLAYYRHHVWSTLYAAQHGCLLHLAAMRHFVQEVSIANLGKYAADSLGTDADAAARDLNDAGVAAARDDLLNTFRLSSPIAERLIVLDELIRRTDARFEIPDKSDLPP